MKTITLVILIVIGALFVTAVAHDSAQYEKLRQYVADCEELGGFVTSVQTGFYTKTSQCSVKPEK